MLAFDDQRIVVGATRETGSGFDFRMTARRGDGCAERGAGVAPGLADASFHEIRIGFRPMSFDGVPLLGQFAAIDGLIIGNGLGASGLTQGPFAGRLLAELVLGESRNWMLRPTIRTERSQRTFCPTNTAFPSNNSYQPSEACAACADHDDERRDDERWDDERWDDERW